MTTHENQSEKIKTKEDFFKAQQLSLEQIYAKGMADFVKKIPNLSEAFTSHDNCIYCIDEGTPGKNHSAGSGILRDKDEVLDAFRKAGVSKITSHDGCGAAVLFAKQNGLDPSNADEYAKQHAQTLAQKLGVPYEHISFEKMKRPADFHIARITYYDNTGQFDYSRVEGLPPGFIISRGIQRMEDSLAEAQVAFGIATGHHGFEELINDKNPFVLSIIAKDEEELKQLKDEIIKSGKFSDSRILIDGFIMPV